MGDIKKSIERILKGIVLVIVPLTLLFFILLKTFGLIKKMIQPIKELLPAEGFFGLGMLSILAMLLLIIIGFIMGIWIESRKERSFINVLEEKILFLIPGYTMLKSSANDAFGATNENWKSVVVGDDDEWKFGIEIERLENDYSMVFFPEPPDAKAGELKMVQTLKIKELNIPIAKITTLIKKYGQGSSELIKKLKI